MANVRYTQEKRIQVAEYVLDGRYSASVASKVFGIGVNTVCRWVNRLCEKRGLPCYRAERKGRRRESTRARLKELVRRNRRLEKQLAHARETAEILKAIPVHLYSTTRFKCEAIHEKRDCFPVSRMCEALGVRLASYYQWIRAEARRAERRERERALADAVIRVFEENRRTYGCRRMKVALANEGVDVSEYRIRRIMHENGLYPVARRRWRPYRKGTCDSMYSENILQREFLPDALNKVWAGDITYIATSFGWLYLAVVIDLCNKEIVGYRLSRNIESEIVVEALGSAFARRGVHEGLVFHSDRGPQYSSRRYRTMLAENKAVPSMSAPGCPYDNACVESFFACLKTELLYRRKYSCMEEVESDIFDYIEAFYNRRRLHSTLGYLSPVEYRLKRLAA
jgi:transposase InsO family protein